MNIALGAINNIASKGFCKAVAELIEWLIEPYELKQQYFFVNLTVNFVQNSICDILWVITFSYWCTCLLHSMLRISRKKILICMYHNLLSCSPFPSSFFSSSLHKKRKKTKELILADLFPNASCMPIIFDNLNLKYQLARMNTTNTSTISKRRIYFSPYYVLAIFSMF